MNTINKINVSPIPKLISFKQKMMTINYDEENEECSSPITLTKNKSK